MPKYNWETGPNEHTPFVIRKTRYTRRGRGRAVCFHCRATVDTYLLDGEDGEENVENFTTHYDQDRGNGYAGRGAGRALGGARRIGPNRENEICVGSDYPPIPLAYKFEDGSPMPYF